MGESETDCNYPVFQPLHNLARHLYNTLTAIYSALYRTTSPLTLDWRTDEISELLDKDPDLIRLFCDIKTEMYWFRMFSQRADARKLTGTNKCNFQIARKIDFIQGILCSRRLSWRMNGGCLRHTSKQRSKGGYYEQDHPLVIDLSIPDLNISILYIIHAISYPCDLLKKIPPHFDTTFPLHYLFCRKTQ